MSALAEPRTGLRDVEPYVSPQLDVAARLNTNECPHPLPAGFFEELAQAVRDLAQAIEAVNDLAAEHVLLLVPDPEAVLPKVRNAGAVFLGHWTAVPYGDYGVASNHVLPTAGTARFSSGLRAADYVTVSSVIQMSQEAARRFTPGTSAIARAEGLVGHAKAMDARAEEAGDP